MDKMMSTDRSQTDRHDRQTDMTNRRTRMKPIYPQTSFARGIKIKPEYVNLHSLSSITTKTFLSDFKGHVLLVRRGVTP